MESRAPVASAAVVVVADDLIWASRLVAAVQRAGATSAVARSIDALRATLVALPSGTAALVDLNGRTYSGLDAVRAAVDAGSRVIAVGQHEDTELRRRALAAGARRVFSYNKLFHDGPAIVARLIDGDL